MRTRKPIPAIARARAAVVLTFLSSLGGLAYGQLNPYPVSPFLPTDPKDCDAYEQAVSNIKSAYSQQHQACLDGHSPSRPAPDLSICSKAACQSLHDIVYGNYSKNADAAVKECRQDVTAYQQKAAAEKAAADKAAAQSQAREARQAENARADSTALDSAQKQAEAQARAFAARTEERSRELADLTKQGDSALQALADIFSQRDQQKDALNDRLSGILSHSGSTDSDKAGDNNPAGLLDRFGDYLNKRPASAASSLSEAFLLMDPMQKLLAPFASIPYAVLKNSVLETATAIDKLSYVITNFDTVDSQQVESIVEDYGKETFTPKAFAVVYQEFYTGAITDKVTDMATDTAKDALKEKAGDILGSSSSPNAAVRQWYPSSQAESGSPSGPVVLVDRASQGSPHLGVSPSLSDAQVEKQIAEGDSVVLLVQPPEWNPGVVYFLPVDVDPPTLASKLKDFAAGEIWGTVEIAWSRRQDPGGKDK